jgi:hypothetical protein
MTAGVAAVAIVAGIVLSAGSAEFVARHAQIVSELDAPVSAVLAGRPGYGSGNAPVAVAPFTLGLLAGDRLPPRDPDLRARLLRRGHPGPRPPRLSRDRGRGIRARARSSGVAVRAELHGRRVPGREAPAYIGPRFRVYGAGWGVLCVPAAARATIPASAATLVS